MISDLDKNKSGTIEFDEFLDMMTARMSDKDTREDINKVFRLFDDDNTGTITLRNLRRVARELGETMTDDELQEMIDRADSNGDGAVTLREIASRLGKPYVQLPERLVTAALAGLKWLGRTQYGPEQVGFLKHRPVLLNRRLKQEFGHTPRYTSREVFELYARGQERQ